MSTGSTPARSRIWRLPASYITLFREVNERLAAALSMSVANDTCRGLRVLPLLTVNTQLTQASRIPCLTLLHMIYPLMQVGVTDQGIAMYAGICCSPNFEVPDMQQFVIRRTEAAAHLYRDARSQRSRSVSQYTGVYRWNANLDMSRLGPGVALSASQVEQIVRLVTTFSPGVAADQVAVGDWLSAVQQTPQVTTDGFVQLDPSIFPSLPTTTNTILSQIITVGLSNASWCMHCYVHNGGYKAIMRTRRHGSGQQNGDATVHSLENAFQNLRLLHTSNAAIEVVTDAGGIMTPEHQATYDRLRRESPSPEAIPRVDECFRYLPRTMFTESLMSQIRTRYPITFVYSAGEHERVLIVADCFDAMSDSNRLTLVSSVVGPMLDNLYPMYPNARTRDVEYFVFSPAELCTLPANSVLVRAFRAFQLNMAWPEYSQQDSDDADAAMAVTESVEAAASLAADDDDWAMSFAGPEITEDGQEITDTGRYAHITGFQDLLFQAYIYALPRDHRVIVQSYLIEDLCRICVLVPPQHTTTDPVLAAMPTMTTAARRLGLRAIDCCVLPYDEATDRPILGSAHDVSLYEHFSHGYATSRMLPSQFANIPPAGAVYSQIEDALHEADDGTLTTWCCLRYRNADDGSIRPVFVICSIRQSFAEMSEPERENHLRTELGSLLHTDGLAEIEWRLYSPVEVVAGVPVHTYDELGNRTTVHSIQCGADRFLMNQGVQ